MDLKTIKDFEHFKFTREFEQHFPNSKIYLVGGVVRDALLDKESTDYDIVVENIDADKFAKFLESHGSVTTVYSRSFGVIKFRPFLDCHSELDSESHGSQISSLQSGMTGCGAIDIALPRREKYEAGKRRKHAEVEIDNVKIEDDLSRRDFTINAIAYDLINDRIVDPFNGQADIKAGIIRAVRDPKERFLEDPTRILRGARFAAQFDFKIEPETFKAMKELAPEITKTFILENGLEAERVSGEMIGQEFLKALNANPTRFYELYNELGLFKLLIPEVEAMKEVEQPQEFHTEGDVFVHTKIALRLIPQNSSIITKLATLLHDIGKPATYIPREKTGDRIRFNGHDLVGAEMAKDVLHRFKLPNEMVGAVSWIIENHMRLFFGFLKSKKDKQRIFIRHPHFKELLEVGKADTFASYGPEGKPSPGVWPEVLAISTRLLEEEKNRKEELITGNEIIDYLESTGFDFDAQKHGKMIGDIKKRINTLYDRDEINSKGEALEQVKDFLHYGRSEEKRKNGRKQQN